MNDMDEDNGLIKDDCLFSAVYRLSSNDLYYFECGNSGTESTRYLFPSDTVDSARSVRTLDDSECHPGGEVTLVDGRTTPLTSLEQQLNLENSNIFDIKIEPNDDHPNNVSHSLSPSSCCSSSPPEFARKIVAFSSSTRARPVSSESALYLKNGTNSTKQTLPPVTLFSPSAVDTAHITTNGTNRSIHEYEPLPAASGRSTPEEEIRAESRGYVKTRSKMHEMAIKQRLITEQDPRGCGFLQLSAEEKRTLVQEGYTLPTRLPLTKSEEEALKIVRRKIKNKLSAQESRRKRKEYIDALERKVQCYFTENSALKLKMKHLEQTNRNLLMQLRKLQVSMGFRSAADQHHPSCPTPNVDTPN